jgi:hypothetical protein
MIAIAEVKQIATPFRAVVERVGDDCLHVSVPLGRDEEEAVYRLKARLAHAGYQVLCYRTGKGPQLGVLGLLDTSETREAQRTTARAAIDALTEHLNLCGDMSMDVSRAVDALTDLSDLVGQLIER